MSDVVYSLIKMPNHKLTYQIGTEYLLNNYAVLGTFVNTQMIKIQFFPEVSPV